MKDPFEPSLTDLAKVSGLQARTIRSWITQGLLPRPLSHGPSARYPADAVQRVLAIRAMRDLLGMSLAVIRQELLIASSEQVEAYAAKAAALAPELDEPFSSEDAASRGEPGGVLDYLRDLRARSASASAVAGLAAPSGFAALEQRLAGKSVRTTPVSAHAEDWLRLSVTPDVELTIRGPLDAEQRAQIERCADLIRDILQGRSK